MIELRETGNITFGSQTSLLKCVLCDQYYSQGVAHICQRWFPTCPVPDKFVAYRMARKLKDAGDIQTLDQFIRIVDTLAEEL